MRALQSRPPLSSGRPAFAAAETVTRPGGKLQMTSLVDMMVILVVFLLQSFSVAGQLSTPVPGLRLPDSASRSVVPDGLVVEVGLDWVRVAGHEVIPAAALAASDSLAVAPLIEALASDIPGTNPNILIQADRRVEFKSLNKVLKACAEVGSTEASLVVLGAD